MEEQWRIELFGGLTCRRGNREISRFRKQKAGSLLAYLAYHPRHRASLLAAHSREVVVEALWPGADIEIGRNNLRGVLHALRDELEPGVPISEGLFCGDRSTIGLRPGSYTTDAAERQAALAEAARALHLPDRIPLLSRAVDLYRGELLPGYDEAWTITERVRQSETHLRALSELARAWEQAGDLDRAIAVGRRAVDADPRREESHCALMRLYAAAGQPSATSRQYQELECVLRDALGETPAAATRALAEALCEKAALGSGLWALGEGGRQPSRQVASPRLPTQSPEPRAQSGSAATIRGLPAQFTRFFGREEEIVRLLDRLCLPDTRLLTLTGPGGAGKTRLAIAVAERLSGVGPALCPFDALAFVPLADLREAERIGDQIADALEAARTAAIDPFERAVAALEGQRWLVILDNFEHLAAGGALNVRRLLERLPALTCLVTSRQRLNLAAEREFPVPPLPVGVSVPLFIDRAQAARPEFRLTEANRNAVAELCERLEGLPLAVELAAARASVLSPAQMLDRLVRRFELLVSRQRDVPARHRSLLAAISCSYDLLCPSLQRFYAGLSVFRGGWTLAAAEAVTQEPRALEYLQHLQECSLVVADEAGEAMRYRLLETLLEFAAEQVQPVERRGLERRHAAFFLALAQRADVAADSEEGAARLQEEAQEHDNLRASLDRCLPSDPLRDAAAMTEDVELGLALGAAMGSFWIGRGYFTEGRCYLTALLAHSGGKVSRARARALTIAARLAQLQEERPVAVQRLYEEGLAMARALEDRPLVASTLLLMADQRLVHLTAAQCQAYCEEALALYRELGDRRGMAGALIMMGLICSNEDARRSRAFMEEGVAVFRELGSSGGLAWACFHLRNAQYFVGEYEAASEVGRECLPLFEQYAEPVGIAACHELQGLIALAQGDLPNAHRHFERLREFRLEVASQLGAPESHPRLGDLALAEGDVDVAETLHQGALAIARELNSPRRTVVALTGLGRVALRRGDPKAAVSRFVECLSMDRDWHHPFFALPCLEGMACALTLEAEQAEGPLPVRDPGPPAAAAAPLAPDLPAGLLRAARLFGAAEAVRDRTGFQRPPREQSEHDAWIATLRASLSDADFTVSWEAGRALSWEEMMACALGAT